MRNRRAFLALPLALAAFVALVQYLGANRSVDPETGRVIRGALSDAQGMELGVQAYEQVLRTARVVERGAEAELVRRVTERLVGAVREDAEAFRWRASLVEDPQANAFCLPGGKIIVNTGILPVTRTEAGLAVVLGHEIAHATLRHGSQRMLRANIAQTLLQGASASVALGDMGPEQQRAVLGALGVGAKVGVLLPFSRAHEAEADERGLLYAARAGYDPREAISFWERMDAVTGQQSPEFLSTHPTHGARRERLRELMPRAVAEFERSEAARKTGGAGQGRPAGFGQD